MRHVVNGECLKEYFLATKLITQNLYSFNELFLEGPLGENILSDEFMKRREQYLHETYDIELPIIHEKNEDLLAIKDFEQETVTMWFDEDVYCQINLLVCLAYFSQSRKRNNILIKLIPQRLTDLSSLEDERIIRITNPNVDQANRIYQNIIVNKKYSMLLTYDDLELFKQLPTLKKALNWYIKLQQQNNELTEYIKTQAAVSEEELIIKLLSEYSCLGLSDMQYKKLIKEVRV